MANYQDKVTIETTVNGQQAEDELKKLRQQAIELKEKIAEVYKTQGKSAAYDSLNKELNKTKRNIVEVQKQMYDVNRTLNNLSSASVRDLRRAYNELNSELKNGTIERGTKAWDEQQQKLRAVRDQLAAVTAEQNFVGVSAEIAQFRVATAQQIQFHLSAHHRLCLWVQHIVLYSPPRIGVVFQHSRVKLCNRIIV